MLDTLLTKLRPTTKLGDDGTKFYIIASGAKIASYGFASQPEATSNRMNELIT